MSDPQQPQQPPSLIVVGPDEGAAAAVEPAEPGVAEQATEQATETVEQPAKVMRIGSMVRQLLEEVRQAPLDDGSRSRLLEVYETSVRELADGLSPDLKGELERITTPFAELDSASDAELRVAQAQLVGWLEGLFHGIQATLFAQQMAARAQLEQGQGARGLPAPGPGDPSARPGTYL